MKGISKVGLSFSLFVRVASDLSGIRLEPTESSRVHGEHVGLHWPAIKVREQEQGSEVRGQAYKDKDRL